MSSSPTPPIPNRLPTVLMDNCLSVFPELICDFQIHATLHFGGRLDLPRLNRAMRLLLDWEPILGCSYVSHWRRPYWQRRDDLDQRDFCTCVPTSNWETDHQAFLTRPINASHDPLVEALVLRGETDIFCLKVNHIIADAGGVKDILARLASLYRQLAAQPDLSVTPNLSGQRELKQVWQQLSNTQKWQTWQRLRRDAWRRIFPFRYWKLPIQPALPTQRRFLFRHIDPEAFSRLKGFARQHNATINDVLVAAFLRALHQEIKPTPKTPLRTVNTVDLRRYLPPQHNRGICNLSGFSYPFIGDQLGPDLAATTNLVRQEMNTHKQTALGLGEFLTLPLFRVFPFAITRHLIAWTFRTFAFTLPPSLTNMGQLSRRRNRLRFPSRHPSVSHGSGGLPTLFCCGMQRFSGTNDVECWIL